MKKKNILGVLPSYSAGGAEKIMLIYFSSIIKRPFSLNLFVVNKLGPFKTNIYNTIECSYKRFLYSVPKLLITIKKKNIEIIFSTFPHISIILLITKMLKLHNCKIVIRQPNMLSSSLNTSYKLKFIKFIYLKVINKANIIIVTSKAMRKEAYEYKLKKNKLFLLPNPVNVLKIRKKTVPRRTKGYGLKLVFVGRLSFQKGLDRVLELFSELNSIEFLIIGEGNQKETLKNIITKHKLQSKVSFYGFMENPYSLVAGADYFLLPSRWEGLPNCVLESLALGTPVISFKDVVSLKDFSHNIKNKTITLIENKNSLLKLLKKLKPRKDYLKPQLRKSLLTNPLNEEDYRNKLDKIILKSL